MLPFVLIFDLSNPQLVIIFIIMKADTQEGSGWLYTYMVWAVICILSGLS